MNKACPLMLSATLSLASGSAMGLDEEVQMAFLRAAEEGRAAEVEALLAKGADVSVGIQTELGVTGAYEMAITNGHLDVLGVLVRVDTTPMEDPPGSGYLDVPYLAISPERDRLTRFMLEKTTLRLNCDMEDFTGESVCQALLRSEDDELRSLASDRMDRFDINRRNGFGQTVLEHAIQNRDLELIALLVREGDALDPETVDLAEFTPIQSALVQQDAELLAAVVRGFPQLDVNRPGVLGTPVMSILVGGDVALMEALLGNAGDRVDGTARDSIGRTPIQIAVSNGDPQMLEVMLKSPVKWDVNAVDFIGRTVLHSAIEKKRTDIARILLAHAAGLDRGARDGRGKTPWDVAPPELRAEFGQSLQP